MRLKNFLLLSLISLFVCSVGYSQVCIPGSSCFDAPLICGVELDGYTHSTGAPNDITQPDIFCGVIENNQWIRFVACETTAEIELIVNSCQGTLTGSGLQAEIFATDDCFNFVSVSNCLSSPVAQNGTLNASGLTPGNIYYLMVDGWAADICNYTIDVISGIDTDPPNPVILNQGIVDGPATACPGETVTYSVIPPQCSNASTSGCPLPDLPAGDFTYQWQLPADAIAMSPLNEPTLTVLWGSVGGSIEVDLANNTTADCNCDWSCSTDVNPLNVIVSNNPVSADTLPTVYICEGESIDFCGQSYSTTTNAICSNDCITGTIQPIVVLPSTYTDLGVITLCNGECFTINGQDYCDGGFQTSNVQDANGCTVTGFTINQVTLDGYFEADGILTPNTPSVEIIGGGNTTSGGTITFEWIGPGVPADQINEQNPDITAPGIYTVTITDPNTGCSIDIPVVVQYQDNDCNLPVAPSDTCLGAPLLCGPTLDGYCSFTDQYTATIPGNLSSEFCYPIDNNSWIRFIPCEADAQLSISVGECVSGQGVEAAILGTDDCEQFQLMSNCIQTDSSFTDTLTANNLIPGEIYYLMLDGIAGASCNWEVNLVSGISVESITLSETQPAQLSGPDFVCLGDTHTYVLTPPMCALTGGDNCPYANQLNELEIEWILPYGARIISEDEFTIEVVWENGSGGNLGALVFTALSNENTYCSANSECGGYVDLPVIVNFFSNTLPPVYLCEGETYDYCGITYSTTIDAVCQDNCGQTIQPIIVEQAQTEDLGIIYICEQTCFTYENIPYCEEGPVELIDSSGTCTDTTRFTIAFVEEDSLVVSSAIEDCDVLGISYRIVFDITSGVPPYYVNGNLLTGTTFISSPIISGAPYYFEITHSESCDDPVIIREGQVACNCMTASGTMSQDTLVSCDGETIQVQHFADEFLDSDDTYEYILHSGSEEELVDPIEINFTGAFDFIPGTMEYGQVYYVSYVAGNAIDGGFVDLNALCLSVAPGQPIVFIPQPYAVAGDGFLLDCNTPALPLSGSITNDRSTIVYEWTGPNDFSSTALDPLISVPGVYTFGVQDSIVGCYHQDTVTVFGDFEIPNITALGDTLNCTQTEVALSAEATGPEVIFTWYALDTVVQMGATYLANAPGQYQVTGQSDNGCRDTIEVIVEDGFDYPEVTAFGGVLNCYEATIELGVNSNPIYNYSWTGPDGFNEFIPNPVVDVAGEYTLEVINVLSGCLRDTIVNVEDEIIYPIVSLEETLTLNCTQPESLIEPLALSEAPEIQYSWIGPNNFLSSEPIPLIEQGGLYELTLLDSINGCASTADITVIEDFESPQLDPIANQVLNCYEPSILLSGQSNTAGASLMWLLPSADTMLNNTLQVTEEGSYQLLAEAPNGCTNDLVVEIEAQFIYPEILASGGIIDCYDPVIHLSGDVNLSTVVFSWTGINGFTSNVSDPMVEAAGQYVLVVTDTLSGCASDTTVLVFNETAYPVVELVTPDLLTCETTSMTLLAESESEGAQVNYQWTGPESITIEEAQSLMPTVYGPGWFTLEAFNIDNGCATIDSVLVEENPNIPQEIIAEVEPLRCHGDTDALIYVDEVVGGVGPYQYSLNGEEWTSTSTFMNLAPGVYNLIAQDENGCILEQSIEIVEPPLVEVTLGANQFITFGESVDLNAQISISLSDLSLIEWTNNNGMTYEGDDIWTVQPFYSTLYEITVADANNCQDTSQVRIFVNRDLPVFIPNAFSPDGDGANDYFTLFASPAITKINTLRVYDRWGELLFQRDDFAPNDPSLGWDGTLKGKQMNSGVFVYFAEVETIEGLSVPFQGDISIIK